MFDPDSRYADIEDAVLVTSEGREVSYKRRRFLPRGAQLTLLVEVTVREGERLDLLTARTLGDAVQWWRVADANDAMNPAELSAPGRALRIPLPQLPGEERR
jgi:nucleoid-associated protein YgaU